MTNTPNWQTMQWLRAYLGRLIDAITILQPV